MTKTTKAKAAPLEIQQGDQPVSKKVLAQSLVDISGGFRALRDSGLTKEAICVLLAHETKVPITTIRKVLDGLQSLRQSFTTL